MVDDDRALRDAGEDAVLAEHDLAEIVVVADAGHDEVLALGRRLRRRRAAAAMLGHPLFRLGGGAVVDRDLVAAFRLEMPRHRVAHHAEPDKRHLRHRFFSACSPDERSEIREMIAPLQSRSRISLRSSGLQVRYSRPAADHGN